MWMIPRTGIALIEQRTRRWLFLSIASLHIATCAAIAADNSSEGHLELSGDLDIDVVVSARLQYATTVNARACQYDDEITGMRIPMREDKDFAMEATPGRYRILIPLARPGGVTDCGWSPRTLLLCVSRPRRAAVVNCLAMFVVSREECADAAPAILYCESNGLRCMKGRTAAVAAQPIRWRQQSLRIDILTLIDGPRSENRPRQTGAPLVASVSEPWRPWIHGCGVRSCVIGSADETSLLSRQGECSR
jgi:hypothetical protein